VTIRRLVISVLFFALVVSPVALGASGCSCGSSAAAATASGACSESGSAPIQPCSPKAVGQSTMGRIAVSQAGPQQTVIWQVLASRAAGAYTTTITIGSTKVYGPLTQDYPPHGSFPAGVPGGLPSGAVFSISGTFAPPSDDVEEYYFQCLLA
jgi:hypothetical protein